MIHNNTYINSPLSVGNDVAFAHRAICLVEPHFNASAINIARIPRSLFPVQPESFWAATEDCQVTVATTTVCLDCGLCGFPWLLQTSAWILLQSRPLHFSDVPQYPVLSHSVSWCYTTFTLCVYNIIRFVNVPNYFCVHNMTFSEQDECCWVLRLWGAWIAKNWQSSTWRELLHTNCSFT
jgi:hypothetical protein